jgi:hypothetical protein
MHGEYNVKIVNAQQARPVHQYRNIKEKSLVNTIPTHALFIKTLIVLKKSALHMFRPVNWPSSGATSV